MAKRPGRPKKQMLGFDPSSLSKGLNRKLVALRKSLGEEIADSAFARWLTSQPAKGSSGDKNAEKLIELLQKNKDIKLPRSGYIVRRGGPKIFVEPAPARAPAKKPAKRGKRAATAE